MASEAWSITLPLVERHYLEAFNMAQYNAMGDGVLTVDRNGTVVLSDRVVQQRFGLTPGALLSEHFPELWGHVEEILLDGQPRFELPAEKEGEGFLVAVNPILYECEADGAICVFVEKKTDLEAMARQLRMFRDLNKELNAIIDSSSEGLWVCSSDGVVLRINPASERLNRVKKEEVLGRNAKELVDQGFIDRSAVLEVIESGSIVNMLQSRGGRKLIITGAPVHDDSGRLIRVVVTERDITEIDKLQRELEDQAAIQGQFRSHMLELQQTEAAFNTVIAKSPSMIKALHQAVKVAAADSAVLLLGESGVGKGLFADLIHRHSSRAEKPLIKINCGAIPESLIESELFGHEKGAFTGAQGAKPGYLELADNGILFLDEIAELPLASQVKLLRFLEDGRVTRLGGTTGRTVNVRIVAATHRNLEAMVEEKTFRLDLYYRLNVIPLTIPALRERRDCIVPLIRHYLDYFSAKNGVIRRLSRSSLDALVAYPYPGNVRELMNICERLVVMTDTETIDLRDLPSHICARLEDDSAADNGWPPEMTLQQVLDSVERSLLLDAMREHGNQYRMADVLGVNQSTIARKLKKYGIA